MRSIWGAPSPTAERAAASLADAVPPGVVRNEHAPEQPFGLHSTNQVDVTADTGLADAIELHPGAALCGVDVKRVVAFGLGVHPDKGRGRHAGAFEKIDLFAGGDPVACVRRNREPRRAMRQRRRAHELGVDL